MATKPSYEELEQRVEELEKEAVECRQAKENLHEQLNMHRTILASTPDLFVLKDRDSVYRAANLAFCKFVGKKEEEIIGKTDFDLFPRAEAERYRRDDERIMETGIPQAEDEVTTGSEGRKCLQVAKTPVVDETGTCVGILCSVCDVSERKRAEEKMRHFQRAVDSASDAIGMSTPEGVHFYQNNAFDELFGEIGQDPPASVYVDERVGREVFETIMRGDQWTGEIKMSSRNRDILDIFLRAYTIKDQNNKVIGLVGVHTDITERKRAEEALQRREAELELLTIEVAEVNTALRVLLKQREQDVAHLEESVLMNVRELVVPYTERLRQSLSDSKQMVYLNILESNLNDIISPFPRKLSSKYASLTPAEIQLAHLIKDGRTTKEIAELLNLSYRTIESHRHSIRTKLGIKNKKANLRAHLSSL